MTSLQRVCVFCGSKPGARPSYLEQARALGAALVVEGLGLVYGGASVGLMGAVADAVLDAGGEAIGVIPEALQSRELAHGRLSELHVVKSMHERKALMSELADAFIALPGGFGTFEELFEIVTWAQLGLHRKPIGLLNVDGYYDPLLALVRRGIDERFIPAANSSLLLHSADPSALLGCLRDFKPQPPAPKWIDLDET